MVAYDLTHEMLREAIGIAGQRSLTNVRFVQGPAEHLPFADDTFDIYTCRTAPHHFFSVPDFLAEACRVLKPGGQFLMADTVTVEDPEVDAWQNRIELLRDPSHVRDYAPSEWLRFIGQAGLSTLRADLALHTNLTFNDWVERSGTPPAVVDELPRSLSQPAQRGCPRFRYRAAGRRHCVRLARAHSPGSQTLACQPTSSATPPAH